MPRLADDSLATLSLTSRLVTCAAAPLKASEYWALAGRVDLATLAGRSVDELAVELGTALAERVVLLLDRAGALAFAIEELDQLGIATIAATDEGYPLRWRSVLGSTAPPHLHLAGPAGLLARPSIGVVGSRDLAPAAVDVAQSVARLAVEYGHVVVSGGARGTDAIAMHAALGADGQVVGVLADALANVARDVELRRAVLAGQLALVTPYSPSAPFSTGNAMGRNKLIYALADVTLVVASDHEGGGTWSGATEALKQRYGSVAVWRGDGEGPGNAALEALGARAVNELDQLLATEPTPTAAPRFEEQLDLGI